MRSKVLSSGGLDISGLHGDNGTVGMSDESGGVSHGIAVVSHGVDSSSGSSMGNLSGIDLSGVSGDNSSVSVSHESSGNTDSVGISSVVGVSSVGNWVDKSTSSSMGSPGSSHLGGVSGNLSSVGVGDQGLGRASGDNSGENLNELIGMSLDCEMIQCLPPLM